MPELSFACTSFFDPDVFAFSESSDEDFVPDNEEHDDDDDEDRESKVDDEEDDDKDGDDDGDEDGDEDDDEEAEKDKTIKTVKATPKPRFAQLEENDVPDARPSSPSRLAQLFKKWKPKPAKAVDGTHLLASA